MVKFLQITEERTLAPFLTFGPHVFIPVIFLLLSWSQVIFIERILILRIFDIGIYGAVPDLVPKRRLIVKMYLRWIRIRIFLRPECFITRRNKIRLQCFFWCGSVESPGRGLWGVSRSAGKSLNNADLRAGNKETLLIFVVHFRTGMSRVAVRFAFWILSRICGINIWMNFLSRWISFEFIWGRKRDCFSFRVNRCCCLVFGKYTVL